MVSNTIPYGLRLIRTFAYLRLVLVLISLFLYLLVAVMGQKYPQLSPLFSSLISSQVNSQFFVLITTVMTALATIISISRRSRLAYFIATTGFIILEVASVVTYIEVPRAQGIEMFAGVPPAIFFGVYWVLIYPYFRDQSFTADTPLVRRLDAFVNPALIISAIALLLGFFYSSRTLLNTTKEYERKKQVYLKAFANLSFKERNAYCLNLPETLDRDMCLTDGFEYTKNKSNITIDSCNLISSEGLRGTCYAMIGECDSIREQSMKQLCELAKQSISPTQSPQH